MLTVDWKMKHLRFEDFIDRQIQISKGVVGWSQEFLDKTFLIAGVGGNGTHVALALVCMGVKEVCIVDKDVVDPSNISRQVLYGKRDIGRKKVEAALSTLKSHTFRTQLSGHAFDILRERRKFSDLVESSDFVFTLVDKYSTAFFASAVCLKHKKPMIHGGTDPHAGHGIHITLQEPDGEPCWNCLQGTGNRAPADWVKYYSSVDTDDGTLDTKKITDYDEAIRVPKRSASIYYTACIGSNFMVLNMVDWFRKVGYYNRIIINLLTMEIWKWRVDPRKDCILCGN